MAELPTCRASQYGVFTAEQARGHGLSRAAVRHLVSTGRAVALSRGIFADAEAVGTSSPLERSLMKAVAACLSLTGSALSAHSAALVHDLLLLGSRPATPTLTVDVGGSRSGGRSTGSTVRIAALPPAQVIRRGAWAVTTVARTVCDLAREAPLPNALVAADAALARGATTVQQLSHVAAGCAGWPGNRRLLEVLEHADAAAESPYETLARWRLRNAGLQPVPQVWAYDARGPIGCGDLWLCGEWVFVEVDGDVKYAVGAEATTLLAEKRRQERLEEAGFGVARVSAREARQPVLLLERVARAAARGRLARAAAPVSTGYVGPPPTWARRGTHIERQTA